MRKIILLIPFYIIFLSVSYSQITINENLLITKISDNCFIHVSYKNLSEYGRVPANGLIYIDGNKAVMIDTPWDDEQTSQLFKWVSDSLKAEILHVIPTHYHVDCMGGLAECHKQGAVSYSLDLTKIIAKNKGLPVPQNTFSDSLWLKINDTKILLRYFGPGHTDDSFCLWIPCEKVLFGGCSVKSANATNLGNITEANLDNWPITIKAVINAYPEANVIVPGHGPSGGIELLYHTLELLEN